jgi:hypothetical protein
VRLLLLFELLQLLRYPIELGLLLGHLLLQLLFLFLPLLHLIANQSAADQTDGSANTSARSGMSGRAADYTAEARSGKCPNLALFSLVRLCRNSLRALRQAQGKRIRT